MATLRELDVVIDAADTDELSRLQTAISNLPDHEVVSVSGLTVTIRIQQQEVVVP